MVNVGYCREVCEQKKECEGFSYNKINTGICSYWMRGIEIEKDMDYDCHVKAGNFSYTKNKALLFEK